MGMICKNANMSRSDWHELRFLQVSYYQEIDPLDRPTVRAGSIIVFAHVVRSYVRPFGAHYSKQNKFKATGETVGLAEWIIDDACLVWIILYHNQKTYKRQHRNN